MAIPLTQFLANLQGPAQISGAPFGVDVAVLCAAHSERGGVAAYVARDDKIAVTVRKLAQVFTPNLETLYLPAWDTLPYDRISPSPSIAAQRCAGLARLAQYDTIRNAPLLVVLTAASLVQRAAPKDLMKKASLTLNAGQDVVQDHLQDYLGHNGYIRCSTVREAGEFAIRGGIVDIFPPTLEEPIRLDFFGDTLETLKQFDTDTQVSHTTLKSLTLAPVSEVFFNEDTQAHFRTAYLNAFGPPEGDPLYEATRAGIRRGGVESWLSLFYPHLSDVTEYLGEDALLMFQTLSLPAAREKLTQIEDYFTAKQEAARGESKARVLAPSALWMGEGELETLTQTAPNIQPIAAISDDAFDFGGKVGRNFTPERARPDTNIFALTIEHIKALRLAGKTVILAAWSGGSAERLANVLTDNGLALSTDSIVFTLEAAKAKGIAILPLPLESGIEWNDIAIIAEPDILGDRLSAPRRKRKAANFITEAASLTAGDLIVHLDHGVGRYIGLKTLTVTGAAHDCLELEYADGDRIFLPVENIELISRYGSDGSDAAIDKLGGVGWQTRKARAKKRILEMAAELMEIAAKRALKKGDVVDPGQPIYAEFAARFPYDETEDQLSAIEDVLDDLTSGRPMDRLVCGDVGFGKTEVAMRGAFMAAMAGHQVAVIAPTTLLARQHYKTFSERFAAWPLEVRQLSRLVPSAEAKATREGLKAGTVDVVVGTHALLAKTIEFKRLGMIVVDEEQRFGVRHKERLKDMKANVHVLTLSATPIPRTLQMALTGIRDLSIIATPPADRLSVRTYVTEHDTVILREALLREKYRGGQAYYVAPRIKDLSYIEDFLRENIPEVTFTVAHGQMGPKELEDIMSAFYDGKFDVLLSTTIVESGLDVPRANTIVIHKANMFGLGQLYQLRGRVGRSKLRAYSYMTVPRNRTLSETAEKRLKVLQSLDSLGAGFQLASHDLDMRGAGNLLGDAQSGHVREVGAELYQSMLEDAVKGLQAGGGLAEDEADAWVPQINLGLSVRIPESYVEDLTERLNLYRRVSNIQTPMEREAFIAELIDRFGALPQETEHLLQITDIKAMCKSLGIEKLGLGPKAAVITFRQDTSVDPAHLMMLVRARPNQLKMKPPNKLVVDNMGADEGVRVKRLQKFLGEIGGDRQSV